VPAVVLFNRVDGADVWMVQGRRGARFSVEALQQLVVLRHIRGKELQGYAAAELGVLGFVNYTHATRAQFAENLVMQDGLAAEILIHISGLIVSGGAGTVKPTMGPPMAVSASSGGGARFSELT